MRAKNTSDVRTTRSPGPTSMANARLTGPFRGADANERPKSPEVSDHPLVCSGRPYSVSPLSCPVVPLFLCCFMSPAKALEMRHSAVLDAGGRCQRIRATSGLTHAFLPAKDRSGSHIPTPFDRSASYGTAGIHRLTPPQAASARGFIVKASGCILLRKEWLAGSCRPWSCV